MKQIILGTAGHIDHGKTSLVKALTGIDTDRLKEEKARGITIELGFAHLELPSGQHLGIVDVPGHEKFVKNMVAGAAGIDLVCLVIAADEGVMPQTREHLDICTLLGIRHGLVALTKIDMVDEEWLEMVSEDVAEYLAGSFLEGAPIVPVSSQTGQGLDQLTAALDELAAEIEQRAAGGPFRLPADRVFTMHGFGTVITGTALDGVVEVGQEVMVYPQGLATRVRGLQVHNQEVNQARRGQRTAMNLQGLEKADIKRGDVVAEPGTLSPSMWLDLQVDVLPEIPRPLKHRSPVRFHSGTAEIMGRLMLLDRDELLPGQSALCQVRLDSPVAVMTGDRYVLRSYSPVFTVAGGEVLHPHPGRHKRNRPEIMADLQTLLDGSPADKLMVHARLAGEAGVTSEQLRRLVNLPAKELASAVKDMLSKRQLVRFDKEAGRMVAAQVWAELEQKALALLAEYHQANPLKSGMGKEELKQRLTRSPDAKLLNHLLSRLTAENKLVAEKDMLRLPDHKVRLAADESALRAKLEKAYLDGGLTPPTFKEASQGEDPDQVRELIKVLVDQGVLVKVKQDLYYHRQALERVQADLVDYLQAHGRIAAPQFKQMTGLSRKFLIPLLEYFDAIHLTIRVGDERQLRKR